MVDGSNTTEYPLQILDRETYTDGPCRGSPNEGQDDIPKQRKSASEETPDLRPTAEVLPNNKRSTHDVQYKVGTKP